MAQVTGERSPTAAELTHGKNQQVIDNLKRVQLDRRSPSFAAELALGAIAEDAKRLIWRLDSDYQQAARKCGNIEEPKAEFRERLKVEVAALTGRITAARAIQGAAPAAKAVAMAVDAVVAADAHEFVLQRP